jgi:hypothetical protein
MPLDFDRVRELFASFEFSTLFTEVLGWSQPGAEKRVETEIEGVRYTARPIAHLAGVFVYEVTSSNGEIPNAKERLAVHREIARTRYENLLLFIDKERTRSEWLWIKREDGKELPRPHTFLRGQPGDLFIGKVAPLLFDISDFEKGDPQVLEVAWRLKLGLDVEKVTKKFYGEFQQQHLQFLDLITGIEDERERRWYASVLLNRLMFIWFLQRKGFLDGGDLDYLERKLEESRSRGENCYYSELLRLLFFEGFAKPSQERSPEAQRLLGEVRYLNGGLFLPHPIEEKNPNIAVPDKAFANLFKLFRAYSWNLNDTPGGDANEINPDVLGYIFEKYINQKAFGAYYTRTEITTYLCERTIHRLVLDAVNTPKDDAIRALPGKNYDFKSVSDLLAHLDGDLTLKLLRDVLPKLSILDPACGSGAFLVAAMKTLINVYTAALGYARYRDHGNLRREVDQIEREHPNVEYYVKKLIITKNLYGVDIMEEAVEIAKLRLFLTLVASAHSADQLEPLPNIDFNLLAGNSLIGLMRVDETKFGQGSFTFGKPYRQLVEEKDRAVRVYRDAATYSEDLRQQRDGIDRLRADANQQLNELLLDEFHSLGIKYGQATWDPLKLREGKPIKRPLTRGDLEELHPFHWGYEFDEIVNKRNGFDAIITNPPWEIVEPRAKEFFEQSKNSLDIKDFESELKRQLRDDGIRAKWLSYLSKFNHQQEFFRKAPEYRNQIPVIDGKRQGKDLNLYKIFFERCFRLLRADGECGIVIPSGIYTDLGATALRELLFCETEVTGLFAFENRRLIFEGVDSRFKFVVLTSRNGGRTTTFPAAFMRHDVSELNRFPDDGSIPVSVALARQLSPSTLSLSEFKSHVDVTIVEKLARQPLLGEAVEGCWRPVFHREFNPTDDAELLHKQQTPGMLPVYQGKMIWQFDCEYDAPYFFAFENEVSEALGKKSTDGTAEYRHHRLGFRRIARNTDERTMIATILPSMVVAVDTVSLCGNLEPRVQCYLVGVLNTFVYDYFIRLRVTTTVNMFYIYQSPVPRLNPGDAVFEQVARRTAQLVSANQGFEDFASLYDLRAEDIATEESVRARLRAEIDAIVAHLYGINDEELNHILATFPIVSDEIKELVRETFRNWKPAADDPFMRMIAAGEHLRLEFKETARWDVKKEQVNKELEHVIVRTVAAFMNSEGGTLLIGVADSGAIPGLERDYRTLGKRQNADAYENWLTTRLLDSLGKDRTRLFRISFHRVEGNEICRVDVERSTRPVFVHDPQGQERLYVRAGNSTRELSVSEALDYCHDHFVRGAAQSAVTVSTATTSTRNADQRTLEIAPPKRRTASFPTHGLFSGTAPPPLNTATAPASEEPSNESETDTDANAPKRRFVDQYDVEDVLLHVRDVVSGSDPMARDEAIREIANRLGAERVGSRVRELVESALNTASRRAIIETVAGGLVPRHRNIDDYERDFLKTALKNVIGRTWTGEDEAIRAATRWLGFRRTGHKIEQAFKSAIRGALKQGLLERDGRFLRVC